MGRLVLAASPESVSLARAFVRERLGFGHPLLDDMALLVSEVVTNAVIHSDSRTDGWVTVTIADRADMRCIRVDVLDAGGVLIPCVQGDVFAENGRGLVLVEALSCRWGIREDDTGRTVWFEVEYRPDTG